MAAIYGDTGASIWPSGIALTRSTRLITPNYASHGHKTNPLAH
jgi:hypothetical protein